MQVLAEQQEEINSYKPQKWVTRREESLFEFDTKMAQVVIGVRRSGKSTLCHKVLLEHGVKYAYVNLDDDRLADMKTEDTSNRVCLTKQKKMSYDYNTLCNLGRRR